MIKTSVDGANKFQPIKFFSIRSVLIGYLFVISSILITSATAFAASDASNTDTTLKVAVFPYLSYSPLYIADAEGFFREQNLSIELEDFRGHSNPLPMLLTEQIDVATIFTIGLLNAIARGEDVRVVANKGTLSNKNCPADGFMVRAGLMENLKNPDPELLKSLTYGVDPVWLDSYILSRALQQWDLDLDDVSTKLVANPAARMEALANGSLDVAFFSEPWVSRVEESAAGMMWLPAVKIVPDFPLGVITFGPTLLSAEQDTNVGERFLRAYLKGITQMKEGPTERNVEIIANATGLDPDTLRGVCWTSYGSRGGIDTDSITNYSKWTTERGQTDRALTPEEFWEPRFIDSALQ